ncbi:hypothetical protein TVAG_130320 [Trichomonas vaginalis G3]|uniref:RSE1/DDB1/CPSF1 C-terminal domain-containing protein n=1 Tax=Trichomonas vaginalis (strain ATCC PRA-98 / G3) TaxID=412133 RepID=A2DIC8_TRIV3|nr:DNA repair/RNA processing CPSF family [Trichomonas vaginalis G3]EAY19924.1 hypothetical protein TVAG_130320 [Trichomonas vaginalis G3]KAI5509941.1 DNA repair/RNA processing CPSF family [Trichomonas vaginalis G3]|eukprot:XP_001580910.1 hypothetical protein [Trichomonas vaginalis G3]
MVLYGDISNIIEIYDNGKNKSNLLVIRSDGRYSVISYQRDFVTLQTGSIIGTQGVPCDSPYKIYKSGYQLVIQVTSTAIQYYEITPSCFLSSPIPLAIPCVKLIDFVVVNINSSTTKVAVLFEDTKMQRYVNIYVLDRKINRFDEVESNTTENDAYRLIAISAQNIVVVTTDKMIRMKVSSPDTESSTIYTSHSLKRISMLSENTAVAVDEGCNVYYLSLSPSGKQSLTRVCSVNRPLVLSVLDETTVFSFSKSGPSHVIHLVNSNKPYAVAEEILFSQESSRILLQMDTKRGDFVSFAPDGTLSIIRKTVGVRTEAEVEIHGIQKSWLLDQQTAVISFIDRTRALKYTGGEISIANVKGLITDESTLAFSRSNGGYVQVTQNGISFNGKITKCVHKNICAFASSEITAVCNIQGTIVLYHSDSGKKYHTHQLNSVPNIIAANNNFISVVFWPSSTLMRIPIEKPNDVLVIPDIKAVDISCYDGAFFAIDNSESIIVLKDEKSDKEELHCEGLHTTLSVVDNNSIFISGEYPTIVKDNYLFSLDCAAKVSVDAIDNTILFCDNEKLSCGTLYSPRFKVSPRKTMSHVYNASQLPNGQFLLVYEHEGSHYATLAASPLDTPDQNNQGSIQLNGPCNYIVGITQKDRNIVCLAVNQTIVLCEIVDGQLEHRSIQKLESKPLRLLEFQGYLLVLKQEAVDLFNIICSSLTDVKLQQRISHFTLGNSTSVCVMDDYMAIGDALESVVLYKFNSKKEPPLFEEIGRNCDILSITALSFFGDTENELIASDNRGAIFSLAFSGTKNYISQEIYIKRSFSIGTNVTSLVPDVLGNYLYTTSESGKHYILAKIQNDEMFGVLDQISRKFIRSTGNLNPYMSSKVVRNGIVLPQGFIDLEVVEEISNLSDEELSKISSEINPKELHDFANGVLNQMI